MDFMFILLSQQPLIGEIGGKVKPKRLSPPSSSPFPKDQFSPNSFSNPQSHQNDGIIKTSPPSAPKNGFVVDPTFTPFSNAGAASPGGFLPEQNGFSTR